MWMRPPGGAERKARPAAPPPVWRNTEHTRPRCARQTAPTVSYALVPTHGSDLWSGRFSLFGELKLRSWRPRDLRYYSAGAAFGFSTNPPPVCSSSTRGFASTTFDIVASSSRLNPPEAVMCLVTNSATTNFTTADFEAILLADPHPNKGDSPTAYAAAPTTTRSVPPDCWVTGATS